MNIINKLSNSKYCQINIIRNYVFKSDLKIKWLRPEKIPCYKPEKSGDLNGIPEINTSLPQLYFRNSKELQTANEYVKKLFSLEFAPKKQTTKVYVKDLVNKTKRHRFDVGSAEVKITRMTGGIRILQNVMETYPRNKQMKVILKELIDKRKKFLKYLRRWDYKRFEWLLEHLDIQYKPPPNKFHWITRKDSLRKLIDIYCDNIRKDRLYNFKKTLQEMQPAFLEEKIRSLQFIRNEQINFGAKVTITKEDIVNTKNQLSGLLK